MKAKKILVVEDDKVSQKLISNVLKSAGYEVFLADNARDAVQMAREHDPDLITLDVHLTMNSPDDAWDGFTVASWIRRINANKPHPVIVVVSGAEPNKIIDKAAAIDAYTFLPKPIEKQKLLDVVASGLAATS